MSPADITAIVRAVLTFRVDELGWTALSIISISVVFIYSVSAAGDPRRPKSLQLQPHNYLARARQRKAEMAAVIELELTRIRVLESWSTKGFRLRRLPIELQLHVLSYSASCSETYRSLVLVSRHIYQLTLRACLPIMYITLSSTKELASFANLVHKDDRSRHILPVAAGTFIHHLWVTPLRREDSMDAYRILRACTNIRVLAVDARGLAMITKSPRFKHTMCTDLTLLLRRTNWGINMDTPSGLQFIRQLTHLRVMGEQNLPRSAPFAKLSHLSYSEPDVQDDADIERPWVLKDRTVFPALQQVALTRRCGPEEGAPLKVEARLVLIQVRRDRTEMDIWRDGLKGESLWGQAAKAKLPPKQPPAAAPAV
ncbi:hypothetical protein DXG01_004155 [Tephrocybe rancida]|nr:hypothetical protein DXG01_004155 [Tephrocybe rancida]